MIFTTKNEEEFKDKVWKAIEPKLKPGLVLGVIGDLGAGKTTLVKHIAQNLGFKGRVSSPTFVMRKTYSAKNNKGIKAIEHIDLYRLQRPLSRDIQEVKEWLEGKDSLVLIEWADLLGNKKYLNCIVKIKIKSSDEREVEILWN